jgi:hypothetical protein
MIRNKKNKELDQKVFEMEARLGMLELYLNNLMNSQGMQIDLDSKKWYSDTK